MDARSGLRSRAGPVVLVASGGFAGAVLRYLIALSLPGGFPWGTLVANVGGSVALGVLLYEGHFADALSAETRLLVGTGFLSSLTTYSAFAAETAALTPTLAAANVAANYGLGFFGILVGRWIARWAS